MLKSTLDECTVWISNRVTDTAMLTADLPLDIAGLAVF